MTCTWKVITVHIPALPFLGKLLVFAWIVGAISFVNEWGENLRYESDELETLGEVLRLLEAFTLYTGVFFVGPFLVIGLFQTC